ncbi:MAG TPA: hypothetical protein VFF03_11185, partial [Rhodocyclaceae bacterium]|nr:hypothetical protein [Rhodocyclaceae bacterium]
MSSQDIDNELRRALGDLGQATTGLQAAARRTVTVRQARQATTSGQQSDRGLRMLLVDDDPAFCDAMAKAAAELTTDGQVFSVTILKPERAEQVVEAVAKARESGQGFDLLLLDYQLIGDSLTATHVLEALNACPDAHVRYLPRLTITAQETNHSLPDLLLGMGADGIHLYKGGGVDTIPTEKDRTR